MFGDDSSPHNQSIRYFKLRNSGAAVVHFLIKDSAGGRTVWEGGPTLAAGSEDIVDLSSTPGVQSGNSYRFGAYVKAGKNATDDHENHVDFKSDVVGIWSWSGTTIVGSKVKFEGYEKFHAKPPAVQEVERLQVRLECIKARLLEGTLGAQDEMYLEVLARAAGRELLGVLVVGILMTQGGTTG